MFIPGYLKIKRPCLSKTTTRRLVHTTVLLALELALCLYTQISRYGFQGRNHLLVAANTGPATLLLAEVLLWGQPIQP